MKPPKEIISIEKKPDIPKKSIPLGNIICTAVHFEYFILLIAFIILTAAGEATVIPPIKIILFAPCIVGQYCDFSARGNSRYAHIEKAVSVGITCFEVMLMVTAVMAFVTMRARLNNPPINELPKEYAAEDISRITVEISSGSNTLRYYVYTADMENRAVKKETYTLQGGMYTVTDTVSREFSEEKAAELYKLCDEAFITKWSDVYLPEIETSEEYSAEQSFTSQYYSISRGGYKKISLEYTDGSTHTTILYDNANAAPKYSGRVLDCVYKLLWQEK